jgi:PAS domain S-box-containing protein
MEQQAILNAIIDSSEDAIISKDLNGIVTSWNNSAERIFGYTADEMKGKHISVIIPPDRQSEEDMIISNLRAGKRIEHFETVRRTKAGNDIFISLTISPVKNAEGRIVGASKIARDITKQIETRELLKQYAERLESINQVGKAIAADLNVENILKKVTDATTDISGAAFGAFFYNKINAEGETYTLFALSGASREDFEKFGMPRNTDVFRSTFDGEGIIRSDDITKDVRYGKNAPHHGMPKGHLPVVSYLAVPVISHRGVVVGGLFFGHPKPGIFNAEHESLVAAIAAQAAVALDNAKLYEEIRSLNAQKDEFIGFASHELKTPLTTVKGYVQLAQNAPEMAAGFMPKIGKQIDRLTALITDLLDISRIHAGRMDLDCKAAGLLELIKNAVDACEQVTAGHQLECRLPTHDIQVVADAQKIEQVIINLVTNAVKYSPPGSKIILSAGLLGDAVQVSVQDSGTGIAKEHVHKIFNRFYRINVHANKAKGLGLGLYISKGIIDAHAGKIWVESEEGKGSVFYFTFPVKPGKPVK